MVSSGMSVPNTVWPTDNLAEVPTLRLALQADAIDQPFLPWGGESKHWRISRQKEFRGTWHFYVADKYFSALKREPELPMKTPAPTLVEPNFSLGDSTPHWLGLHEIGWKRWIARYWQSQGRRILVDLHVPEKFQLTNLIGVPTGWRAYATRAAESRIADLESEHMLAMAHAEVDDPSELVYAVYGGGDRVRDWCRRRSAEWIPATGRSRPL
jgi:hypothetical protein